MVTTTTAYRTASGSVYEVRDGCVRRVGGDPRGRVNGWTRYRAVNRLPAVVRGPGRKGEILEIVLESGRALYTSTLLGAVQQTILEESLKPLPKPPDVSHTGSNGASRQEVSRMAPTTLTREVYRTESGTVYEIFGNVFRRRGARDVAGDGQWTPYVSIEQVPAAVRRPGLTGEVMRIVLEDGRTLWSSPLVDEVRAAS